jgi:negative regulator of flagellin synthesis FlgM
MKVPGEHLVPNKINVLEPKLARVTPAAATRALPGATADAGSDSATTSSDVHLTGAARSLAAIEQSLRALPAVDELRVAAVQQRLHDGSYEIDPQRVADRLLRLESDLARVAPFDGNPLK